MAQESILVISVDARNAERRIKALDSALDELDRSGESASSSIRDIGATADTETTRLDKFKTSISALAAESKVYFAGIAGAAVGTAGALVALAVQTANTAAEIERLAYLSGATTTEFQEWAVGARAMGIEMDNLSDIFKDVQDRVGDFITTGGGELADFFTEIATKTEGGAKGALELAKSMRELSGPQALQLYVDKLKEAGVSQSEMVFFMESVADEATALIPLLENGGEGFRLWAEAARNAGAIMDNETLAAAQRLKIETQLLEMQMTGLKNQFMSGLFPALNQIASAFTGAEGQALSFKSAGEAVGNTLIWLTKVGTGVAATFDIAGKVIGGAAAAMTNEGVTSKMVLDDIAESIDQWGTKLNKLNDNASNKKMTDALLQVQLRANETAAATAKSAVNTTKMQETFDKASGSSKKVADNTARISREAEQAAEEVRKIMYEYSSDETKKAIDLQKEITRLQKYGQTQYIEIAKARYEEEKKLAKMRFEYELVEHRISEEQKLRFSYNIREQEIIADTRLTKEQTEQKLSALNIAFKQELYDIKLAADQRLFEATEFQYTEMDAIKKRYELERREIGKIHDEKERNALLEASIQRQNQEESNVRDQAISDYASVMGFEENPLIKQFEVLDKMRELDLINEQAYQDAKLQIQAKSTASYMEGMIGGFASLVDENSKTYAVLFAAQKAFAVAQAVLNIPQAYSKAYNAVVGTPFVGPYIAPAVGAAAAALQVAQAAKVKSVSMQGFESGGYTGNVGTKTVAGVVHGQEYVMNAKATKSIGVGNLETLAKTGELPNQQAQQTTNIINVFDESELRAAMATPAGEKIILNTITRNRSKLGI